MLVPGPQPSDVMLGAPQASKCSATSSGHVCWPNKNTEKWPVRRSLPQSSSCGRLVVDVWPTKKTQVGNCRPHPPTPLPSFAGQAECKSGNSLPNPASQNLVAEGVGSRRKQKGQGRGPPAHWFLCPHLLRLSRPDVPGAAGIWPDLQR